MAFNLPRKSIRKSPKLASPVSLRLRKKTFFAGVPLQYLGFLVIVCNVYLCMCFCHSILLKELRAYNRFLEGFRGVITSVRPLKPLLRYHWNRGNRFLGLIETKETASAVSFKPWKQLQRSHWNCQTRFRSLIETEEAVSAVSLRPL
jgi:hypothetical protein